MSDSSETLDSLAVSLLDVRLQIDAQLRTLTRAQRQTEQVRIELPDADADTWCQAIDEELALLESYQAGISTSVRKIRHAVSHEAKRAAALEWAGTRVVPFVRRARPALPAADFEQQSA